MGIFYNVCFGGVGLLVADMARYQAIKPNQHVFTASGRMKEGPFSAMVEAEVRVEFLFSVGMVLSLGTCRPYFLSGASVNFYTFLNLFSFIYFLFSNPYRYEGWLKSSYAKILS